MDRFSFEAHELALEAIKLVRPIIEKHDPDLARQMRKAATSAPSNSPREIVAEVATAFTSSRSHSEAQTS